MKIASILGLDAHPDEFWPPGQWRVLRQEVSSTLAKPDLPDLGSGS